MVFLYKEPPVILHFWTFPLFTGGRDCQGHFLLYQVVKQPGSYIKATTFWRRAQKHTDFHQKKFL